MTSAELLNGIWLVIAVYGAGFTIYLGMVAWQARRRRQAKQAAQVP